MGVDTGSALLVGAVWDDLPEDIREAIESDGEYEGLDRVSPYYDAGNKDCVFGVVLASSGEIACEVDFEQLANQKANAEIFLVGLGITPRTMLSPWVT